ncbi:hypothetical protein ACFODO_11070 [Acinetobacter sichuanensis]|uniref:Uncharacterized protein n=1 Tax=Acinetobacter sichuanensis TaxID=2136183 RepID=A0A371YNX1_9GAMM|nr:MULTISPECIES: hypothetical protein [Acinetobacter]MDM1765293.1 hypothetical protein [Acinetobacter sp. 226-1]MDM1768798.1 hypothetical protein [Acinetobacter sp. 226-4]MDQ9022418.1 hypothetical protein [Acinetobacter sichuanensis]RFC83177.1 hypothetical protein C9E89_013020 [Acinetobacter sichuanensis]
MFRKISEFFQGNKNTAEQAFLTEQNIQIDEEQGFIVDGIVVNELSERLVYFSNRKLQNFDDLKSLFYTAILINEKIDLEIASGRYVVRLGNNEENLKQLKQVIYKLNAYYKEFKREK